MVNAEEKEFFIIKVAIFQQVIGIKVVYGKETENVKS